MLFPFFFTKVVLGGSSIIATALLKRLFRRSWQKLTGTKKEGWHHDRCHSQLFEIQSTPLPQFTMNIQDMSGRFTIRALWPAHMRTLLKAHLYSQHQQGFSVATMSAKVTSDFSLNAYIHYPVSNVKKY